jgi:cbb3-type cytochrome oxidase subunit 3
MNWKKYLPHLVAVAAFLAISLTYFSPLLDGKKQIRQSDVSQFKGTAQEIIEFRKEHNGEEPLWTNSMFGGMPAYQISTQSHNNFMKYVDDIFQLFLPFPVSYVFLYFIGFYILLMCLRVNPWIAIVGSLAYGFSSFFFIVLEVGHNTQAHAIGYAAPFIGAVLLTLRRDKWLGGALLTLFAALELYCNHVQITYYFLMIVLAICITEFITALKEKRLNDFIKRIAIMAIAIGLAVLPNTTSLWTTYEYGKYTTRSPTELTIKSNKESNADVKTSGLDRDYATMWSYGIGETFTLLIPNFKGGVSEMLGNNKDAVNTIKDPQMRQFAAATTTSYFGEQYFTSGPVYVGCIMVFLSILGLFIIKDRLKWALLIVTIVGVMLSWGKNLMWFTNIFFDYFPGYNKFRSVTMILVIAELTIPLLAVLGLQKILESSVNTEVQVGKRTVKIGKLSLIVAAVVGGFALLCYVTPGTFNTFHSENDLAQITQRVQSQIPSFTQNDAVQVLDAAEEARRSVFRSDAIRTFVFIVLSLGAVWFYLNRKIKLEIFVVALGIFVLADMWPVAMRYLSKNNYVPKSSGETVFAKSKADEFILQDKSPDYRVLNYSVDAFNDGSTSYWHKSIGGYHGAKLKRYKELIDFQIEKDIRNLMTGLRTFGVSDSSLRAAFSKTQVLNMLNTKYVIFQEDAPPLVNPDINGNAWFVKDIVTVGTADDEILRLGEINTKESAVMNIKYSETIGGFKPQYDPAGTIKLTSYQPNKLSYESNAKGDQFAVFSEIYYPKGWIATVDGKETPIVNVDYVLRAIVVPSGKHTILFEFKPAAYYTGEKISLVGSLLVLVVSIGGVFMVYRKKRTQHVA